MKSKKIVIAPFGKLKGHVIDWFDLKYVYPHHTVATPLPLFYFLIDYENTFINKLNDCCTDVIDSLITV